MYKDFENVVSLCNSGYMFKINSIEIKKHIEMMDMRVTGLIGINGRIDDNEIKENYQLVSCGKV